MKSHCFVLGAALGLALLATGCETTGTSARIQEKSAEFATLKVWEKNFIQQGVVSSGFTPDMVYMAVGNPSKAERVNIAGVGQGELWTYSNFYPAPDANHMDNGYNSMEATYLPTQFGLAPVNNAVSNPGALPTTGYTNRGQSISATGRPQGSMEIGDLQAFSLRVLFKDGKVIWLSMKHA